MNLRDLAYLVAVSKYHHFGKAAEACHVSQPTLSMQLKKLEEFLEVQLIERTTKHVMLTAIGQEMVGRAETILQEVDAMRHLAMQTKDPEAGQLHLGSFPTIGPYFLPGCMPGMKAHFPRIEIFLHEEKTATLIAQLLSGTLDAALLALPIEEDRLVSRPLFEEPFLLAVPASHFISVETVTYNMLQEEKLLLLGEGHCLRGQALAVCEMAGMQEDSTFRGTSLEMLRAMVLAGQGCTLLPMLAAQKTEGIRYIPFAAPVPSRTIGLVWRKTSARAAFFESLAKYLTACYGDIFKRQ